jgi:hydrogenase expression/formation protein HypC
MVLGQVYLLAYTVITSIAMSDFGMHDQYDFAHAGRVIQIEGELAKVDLGGGTMVDANIALADVKVGDYVLVHAGYVLKVLEIEEIKRNLTQWR